MLCDVTVIYAKYVNKLLYPRTIRVNPWNVTCVQFSSELICNSMSSFNCILCFKEITKDYERFLVNSRKKTIFDVNIALANLYFHVYTLSEYICRQCHGVLKKRQNLQQNLDELNESPFFLGGVGTATRRLSLPLFCKSCYSDAI